MSSASGGTEPVEPVAGGRTLVVVPTFDRPAAISGLLRALARQSFRELHTIVVDHGTKPVDADLVRNHAGSLEVLRASSDLWWTGAINVGLRRALETARPEDRVLLLNDDTTFDERFVERLTRHASAHPGALVGAVCLVEGKRTIVYASWRLDRLRGRFVAGLAGRPESELPPGQLYPSDVLSGRGLLIPAPVFERVGLFAERELPHYGADYEFSWRARVHGFSLYVSSDARVYTGERPSGGTQAKTFRSFACEPRRPSSLPTAFAFARLCFSPMYGAYYTAVRTVELAAQYARLRGGLASAPQRWGRS